MKDVQYDGPHDEVELPSLGLVCARGETVSVLEEIAEQLVEQEHWSYPAKSWETAAEKKKAAAEKAAAEKAAAEKAAAENNTEGK